ncbi:MAG: fibronectin type III domain-containing protein [bacterium]|nr:fibronectin type III domain-containing protein [bacterium]
MINQISRKATVFFLLLALGLTPALSYAKNDDTNQDNDDNNKEQVEKSNDSCLKAFGHLFAPGFIKNKGGRSFSWDCFLPFGIGKKFSGTASSTPDTIAPIITSLSVKPNTTKATVTWNTNEKSDSAVFWSLSSPVNINVSTTQITRRNKTKDHKIVIENLTASTTYYLVVRSKDATGNISLSTETSFNTKAATPDTASPTISSIVTLVGTSTINFSWETNENATSRVYYGTSASLDVNASTASFVENSTLTKNHILSLNGLTPQTLYYLAVESKDANGNKTTTPVFNVTTKSTI